MNTISRLAALRESCGLEDFEDKLRATDKYPLRAGKVEVLQMNIGKRCNLYCRHCHVDAGPGRSETMGRKVLEKCLDIIGSSRSVNTVDITGGAPEMNPNLKWFIERASKCGKRLIVRSNLAILTEKEYEGFANVYAGGGVEVCASLPDCGGDKTGRQREKTYIAKLCGR